MQSLTQELARELHARGWKLAVAESCTGGGLGARLTDLPGSSAYFLGGVIAYDNRIKREFLGVSERVFEEHGAVSRAAAEAMASGCRTRFDADLAVAITGIAGPSGGTPEKSVGLVYLAVATEHGIASEEMQFSGDRRAVRRKAVEEALQLAVATVRNAPARSEQRP